MSTNNVSLIIPGRNASSTLRACLDSVMPMLNNNELSEIIFVDDGSTDDTWKIAHEYPIKILKGHGEGAGKARNRGIEIAQGEWIWFIDSDCVAEPYALAILLEHSNDDSIAAVGGSYGNMRPDKLLSQLINEEIAARHKRMGKEVNFIATFNVLYRKDIIKNLGGFDQKYIKAQDAELAYRARSNGYKLYFDIRSKVKHFHESNLIKYLSTQHDQGYWRMFLYRAYPEKIKGDSYSGPTDYAQPPLALISILLTPITIINNSFLYPTGITIILLFLCQIPMALLLYKQSNSYISFIYTLMSTIRAYARSIGMLRGFLNAWLKN